MRLQELSRKVLSRSQAEEELKNNPYHYSKEDIESHSFYWILIKRQKKGYDVRPCFVLKKESPSLEEDEIAIMTCTSDVQNYTSRSYLKHWEEEHLLEESDIMLDTETKVKLSAVEDYIGFIHLEDFRKFKENYKKYKKLKI